MEENKIEEMQRRKIPFNELMRWSASIYRRYFHYILGISLFVNLPVHIIGQFFPARFAITTTDIVEQNMERILPYIYFAAGIFVLFTPLAIGATTSLAHQALKGEDISVPAMLDASLQKWHKHIVTMLIIVLAVISTSCLFVLALYVAITVCLSSSIVAVSDSWGLAAMRESNRLVFGSKKFVLLLFIMRTAAEVSIFPIVTTASAHENIAVRLFGGVMGNVLLSFFSVVFAVFFLNIIYLKEFQNAQ